VNCVAAALYAMTCFDGTAFPPEEAEVFVSRLFRAGEGGDGGWSGAAGRSLSAGRSGGVALPGAAGLPSTAGLPGIGEAPAALLREHILGLYRRFLRRRPDHPDWKGPLLEFLAAGSAGEPA
jgi:hypothetical protein